MGDSYGYSGGGGGGKKVAETEELQEDDVWAMISAREGSNTRRNGFSSPPSACRVNATPRSIPRSAASGGRQEWSPRQLSAPVSIPDWSKILRKKSKKSLWDDARNDDHGDDDAVKIDVDYDGGGGGGGEEEEMAPPHEYLARRLARTQIASHSMCEGVGRTLKGRDLSKVRNAVLTKTGFIE